jgi:23S rRNA (guanosine2251-2'-O)-methyltransferase
MSRRTQKPNRPHGQKQNDSSARAAASSKRAVIGLHAAREVLKVRPDSVTEIWLKEGAERNQDHSFFLDFAKKKNIKVSMKNDGQLNQLATSHQGVCVYTNETPQFDFDELSADSNEKIILIALDEVTDPHNVGAVLRTSWLLGAKAILVPENRSAHLTPATVKVACGGAEHVPLMNVGNLAQTLTTLKDKGFWIYGLSHEAKNPLWRTKFHEKVVLVVGAEDKGMRSTTANICDELVSIPQVSAEASFNASVAASLVLYEVARQHKNP